MDEGFDTTSGGALDGLRSLVEGFGLAGWFIAGVAVLVALGFVWVLGTLVVRGVRYGLASPQSAPATCVAKRTQVTGGGGMPGEMHSGSTTWYHATFEFADGSRRELSLTGTQYGLLAEGDHGELIWRDTVFKGLDRSLSLQPPSQDPTRGIGGPVT